MGATRFMVPRHVAGPRSREGDARRQSLPDATASLSGGTLHARCEPRHAHSRSGVAVGSLAAVSRQNYRQRLRRRSRRLTPQTDTGESGRPNGSMNSVTGPVCVGTVPSRVLME